MNEQMIKDIPNWEKEYPSMDGVTLSPRQKELLNGDEIKSHEGMVYGRMYADWKRVWFTVACMPTGKNVKVTTMIKLLALPVLMAIGTGISVHQQIMFLGPFFCHF